MAISYGWSTRQVADLGRDRAGAAGATVLRWGANGVGRTTGQIIKFSSPRALAHRTGTTGHRAWSALALWNAEVSRVPQGEVRGAYKDVTASSPG